MIGGGIQTRIQVRKKKKRRRRNHIDLGNKAADHLGVTLLDPIIHVVVLLHLGLDNLNIGN